MAVGSPREDSARHMTLRWALRHPSRPPTHPREWWGWVATWAAKRRPREPHETQLVSCGQQEPVEIDPQLTRNSSLTCICRDSQHTPSSITPNPIKTSNLSQKQKKSNGLNHVEAIDTNTSHNASHINLSTGHFHLNPAYYMALLATLLILCSVPCEAVVPTFYEAMRMSVLRLPADTEPGSIIFRLRARDGDRNYPLTFDVGGNIGRNLIRISAHNCSRNQYFCDADVYLKVPLEEGRLYNFNLTVYDTNNDRTDVLSRIEATNGRTTNSDIFLKYSPTAIIPEDMEPGPDAVVTTMIVRSRRQSNFIDFRIQGESAWLFQMTSRLHGPDSNTGSLILKNKLDYETSNLHQLLVCALNPYTNETVDTRNIACVTVSVVVTDVQDQPPYFVMVPPISRITSEMIPNDQIAKVHAEDGDKGAPRALRYSMKTASTLYANFFDMDPFDGIIRLKQKFDALTESMDVLEPILITITAEEVVTSVPRNPALTTEVEIAFVVIEPDLMVPKFIYEQYVGEIRENSSPDSIVSFPKPFLTRGVKGVFSLHLEGDDGIFSVSPNIVRENTDFIIKVKNSALLDYEERHQVDFMMIAKQVSAGSTASSSASITVRIMDINDNVPEFTKQLYRQEIYENITAGTSIIQVSALDRDTGDYGLVRYTRLEGPLSDRLSLDPITGLITCNHNHDDFDREMSPEYQLTIEARDDNGNGNSASARLLLILRDVNDSPPRFLETVYKGVMSEDRLSLKVPLRVEAVDDDAEEPNNQIIYRIERDTFYSDHFRVNSQTGEISVRPSLLGVVPNRNKRQTGLEPRNKRQSQDEEIITFSVTAADLGVPQLKRSVPVQIYTQDYVERYVKFIYPKPKLEVDGRRNEIEHTLGTLTGGIAEIKEVVPYGYTPSTRSKSIISALVQYTSREQVIDLSEYNRTSALPLIDGNEQTPVMIKTLESENSSLLAGVIVLCLLVAAIISILLCCCCCPGCLLYTNRKKNAMVAEETPERISYIRMDERGNIRGIEEERTWYDYLPTFMQEIVTSCGWKPDRDRGRLAWSADERQQYWRVQDGGEGVALGDRGPRRIPRDLVMLEDYDDRLQAQRGHVRVDSRTSHRSNEAAAQRRMFVLRDGQGLARPTDSLREGEQYVMEDVAESPNMMRIDEDGTYARQGNAEVLRLHASPRGTAMLHDEWGNQVAGRRGRQPRRAGELPGDLVMTQEEFQRREELQRRALLQDYDNNNEGGMSSRMVEGSSVHQTPRSNRETSRDDGRGYANQTTRYPHSESPPHLDVQIQTDDQISGRGENIVPRLRIRTPIEEETYSQMEAEDGMRSSRRDRKARRNSDPEEVHEDNVSRRSVTNQLQHPHPSHYHHTKSSILRFEANKAKLEEDPDPRKTVSTTATTTAAASRRTSYSDGRRSSSVDSKSRSQRESVLSGKRSNSQTNLESQRDNSASEELNMEKTGLEREAAARRSDRQGSNHQDEGLNKRAAGSDEDDSDEEGHNGNAKNRKGSRYMDWYKQNGNGSRRESLAGKTGEESLQGRINQDGEAESQTENSSTQQTNSRIPRLNGSNLPDEVKISQEAKQNTSEIISNSKNKTDIELSLDASQTSDMFNNNSNLEAEAALRGNRRKRNHLLEKKSIFTIAYDDIQTEQLRPESAAAEP